MRLSHGTSVVAAAMFAAGAAGSATAGETGAVPDPNLTGVAPAQSPTAAITPGPVAPEPVGEPSPTGGNEGSFNEGSTIVPEWMMAPHGWQPKSGYGVAVVGGGGVADFSNGAVRTNTGVAGYWEARAAFGTRNWWGIETAYNGSAGSISGLGLAQGGTLVRNGLEATGRLNLPLYAKSTLLEPYAFGGIGWNMYSTSGVTNSAFSDVGTGTDNVFTLPFGLGFMAGYKGLVADARFTYRPTYGESLVRSSTGNNNDLSNWNLGAALGYEF